MSSETFRFETSRLKRTQTRENVCGRYAVGMINYLARYIPDLSTRTMPLRKLLDQKVLWMWNNEQEKLPVLMFYDPNKPVK